MVTLDDGLVATRHPQVAFRVVAGEGVVVLAEDGQVEVVNKTGARILELVDGHRTLADIASHIAGEFDVPEESARADVAEFVGQMVADRVLVCVG